MSNNQAVFSMMRRLHSPESPPLSATPAAQPWRWIPTLYFAQGLPYVVVMTLSVVMYKNLGLANTEIALYTSWLYLPWVIKPLWGPLVELLGTKRRWIVAMQLLVGAALCSVALTLPTTHAVRWSLAVFWLMAFASATHDIAADGFYMLALPQSTQAAFVGVRSTCYRLAMIAGQGGLVVLAGWLQDLTGNTTYAWAMVMGGLGVAFVALSVLHGFSLPRPVGDQPAHAAADAPMWKEALAVFRVFFQRPDIGRVLAFLLLYRFAEAQLLKLVTPFMLDPLSAGGLGLKTQDVGIAYGTVGVAALTMGGLLGGWVISRAGLQRVLWPLMLCMHLPNLVFVALAWAQPQHLGLVSAAVALEQFGYGFGFTAYMVFMMMVAQGSQGAHQTAHYALCTGFMALGMMLPGMAAGWLQSRLGYSGFFVWVCVATLPSFWAAARLRIEPGFGKKVD